jgi:Tol biopolymer transport system component
MGLETQPSISPDGRFIVYVAEEGGDADIFLMRIGGDNPINLTADSPAADVHPAFSPDGSRIAFRSEREGGGVFVMGATGESVRRLTDFGFNPAWAPSGNRLVVADEPSDRSPRSREVISRLHVVDAASGASEVVPGDADRVQPSWSPGGQRIAFWGIQGQAGQRDLGTVRPDGSDASALTLDPALDWNPVWSPDGRFVYFSSDRGGSLNLWRIPIDEPTGQPMGDPQPLSTPSGWAGQISLDAEGVQLAYTALDRRANVEVVETDPRTLALRAAATAVTRGTTIYHSPTISPDGEWLALAAVDHRENIVVVRADGSRLRRLTDDAHRDRAPEWSPDGESIVFYSDRDAETYRLWAVRPDGSAPEPLTGTGSSMLMPVWSPDGRQLAANFRVSTVVMELTAARPLTFEELPNPGDVTFQASSWSPDGRRLVGPIYRDDGTYAPGLLELDVTTLTYRRLSDRTVDTGEFRSFPVWLGDGRRIVFGAGGRIYLLDTMSGEESLLLAPPPGSRYFFPRPSPDETRLFFVHLEEEADVHVVRLTERGGRG